MNRLVWIDPDGFVDHDWMAVIVRAATGISYRQQYGGTVVPVAGGGLTGVSSCP